MRTRSLPAPREHSPHRQVAALACLLSAVLMAAIIAKVTSIYLDTRACYEWSTTNGIGTDACSAPIMWMNPR